MGRRAGGRMRGFMPRGQDQAIVPLRCPKMATDMPMLGLGRGPE